MMVKLRLTLVQEYEVEDDWYPSGSTPEEMAKIDEDHLKSAPRDFLPVFGGTYDYKVEVVEE